MLSAAPSYLRKRGTPRHPHEASPYQAFAVSPPTRFATPKARALVDFLARRLR